MMKIERNTVRQGVPVSLCPQGRRALACAPATGGKNARGGPSLSCVGDKSCH